MVTLMEILDIHLAQVKISKENEPQKKVGKNEKVIGIMPDYLKRLYVLVVENTEELARHIQTLSGPWELRALPSDKQKIFIGSGNKLAQLMNLSSEMFWCSLRHHFADEFTEGNKDLGIRKGWKVTSADPKFSIEDIEIIPNFMYS